MKESVQQLLEEVHRSSCTWFPAPSRFLAGHYREEIAFAESKGWVEVTLPPSFIRF